MPKTYKAAIIGLGGFSGMHVIAYSMAKRVSLVAACDIDPARHAQWAKRVKDDLPDKPLQYFDDAAKMLAEVRPDIVTITTKHDQHAPLTILCAKAGVKGVICEKPIAMDLGEADAMLAACRKSGTKLAIGHQRRFNQEWQAGLKLLQRGTIGKVLLAVSRWPDGNPPGYYHYSNLGGGPLMWLSIHSIDLLRYYLGDVAWATGHIDMSEPGCDCERRAYGLLAFKNGAQAVVDAGQGIGPEASNGHSITLYGQKGAIQVADGHGTRYKTTANPRWRKVKLDEDIIAWRIGARYACAEQIKDMIRAIERDEDPRCSGREGRADLEAALAIYEAERTGGVVKMPLRKKTNPLGEMNKLGGFGQVTWPAK